MLFNVNFPVQDILVYFYIRGLLSFVTITFFILSMKILKVLKNFLVTFQKLPLHNIYKKKKKLKVKINFRIIILFLYKELSIPLLKNYRIKEFF